MSKIYKLANELTTWSRGLPEKLTGPQLVKNFMHFVESESSLPHLRHPATCPITSFMPFHNFESSLVLALSNYIFCQKLVSFNSLHGAYCMYFI